MTPQGLVARINTRFLEMLGRSVDEVVGHPIESIVADEDMLRLVGVSVMFKDAAVDSNMIFVASDGSLRRLIVCSSKSPDMQRILLTARVAGAVQEELASTTRWAVSEQERAQDIAQARDALAAKNHALYVAQQEVEAAYVKLQGEVLARERLEKELRLAQKLEGIGQLAAGVAHEINTPMQYVGDNVNFLARAYAKLSEYMSLVDVVTAAESPAMIEARSRLDASKVALKLKFLTENVPKALRDSKAGIEHVSGIVRALKSFAHVDSDEKTLGDINQAIRDTLAVSQNEYKSVATVETDLGELPTVMCFIGRLNQVLLNLIVNAAHAIAEAGRGAGGVIRVRSRAGDGVVSITVADNGAGIPEHVRERVFDAFFTTKPVGKGTGQGLSLARSIVVDAHGGSLTFSTELGKGTEFTIVLPIDGRGKVTVS
jgi:signal transduction histidine kinase